MPEQKFHPGDRVRATWTICSTVFEGATGIVVSIFRGLATYYEVSWDGRTNLLGPDGSRFIAYDYELAPLESCAPPPAVDPAHFLTLLHTP